MTYALSKCGYKKLPLFLSYHKTILYSYTFVCALSILVNPFAAHSSCLPQSVMTAKRQEMKNEDRQSFCKINRNNSFSLQGSFSITSKGCQHENLF